MRTRAASSRASSSLTSPSLRVTWTSWRVRSSRCAAVHIHRSALLQYKYVWKWLVIKERNDRSVISCFLYVHHTWLHAVLLQGHENESKVNWCKPKSTGLQPHSGWAQWIQVRLLVCSLLAWICFCLEIQKWALSVCHGVLIGGEAVMIGFRVFALAWVRVWVMIRISVGVLASVRVAVRVLDQVGIRDVFTIKVRVGI